MASSMAATSNPSSRTPTCDGPTRAGKQTTLGIHPEPDVRLAGGASGPAPLEKTPADLYRIDSSRDFGISFSGPRAVEGLKYAVQYGNDSGNGSESRQLQDRARRGPLRAQPRGGVRGPFSASHGRTARIARRLRASRLLEQRRPPGCPVPVAGTRVGKRPASGTRRSTSGLASLSGTSCRKGRSVRSRRQRRGEPRRCRHRLPGADAIDYLLLEPDSSFTTWIVGGEWCLVSSLRIGRTSSSSKTTRTGSDRVPGKDVDPGLPAHLLLRRSRSANGSGPRRGWG